MSQRSTLLSLSLLQCNCVFPSNFLTSSPCKSVSVKNYGSSLVNSRHTNSPHTFTLLWCSDKRFLSPAPFSLWEGACETELGLTCGLLQDDRQAKLHANICDLVPGTAPLPTPSRDSAAPQLVPVFHSGQKEERTSHEYRGCSPRATETCATGTSTSSHTLQPPCGS